MLGDCDKLYKSLINCGISFNQNLLELAKYWKLLYKQNKYIYPVTAYLDQYKTDSVQNVNSLKGKEVDAEMEEMLKWAHKRIIIHQCFRLGTLCQEYLNDYDSAQIIYKFLLETLTTHKEDGVNVLQYSSIDDGEDVSTLCNHLGSLFIYLKQYEQSIKYSLEALEIEKHIYDENDFQTASTINNIGEAYLYWGEETEDKPWTMRNTYFRTALDYLEMARDIRLNTVDENHSSMAVIYSNLASVYGHLGDLDKSYEYHKKSLALYLANYGKDNLDTAVEYMNIGSTASLLKKFDISIENLLQALNIFKSLLGENNKHVLNTLEALSVVYHESGDLKQAINYGEQTVILQNELEGETYDLSDKYNLLGTFYVSMQMYDEAADRTFRAIEILNNIGKGTSNRCGILYANLGKYLFEMNDKDNALEAYSTAIAIHKAIDEKSVYVADSLSCLAKVYYRYEMFENSCQSMQEAYDMSCEIRGENDTQTIQNYNMLQQLKQTSPDEKPSAQEAGNNNVDIDEFPDDTEEGKQLNETLRQGVLAYRRGHIDRSIPLLLQVLKKSESFYGDESFQAQIVVCRKLGYIYEERKENDEAKKWYEKAIAFAYNLKNKKYLSGAYKAMAEFYWNIEDYHNAVENYLQEVLYHNFQPDELSIMSYGNIAYALYKLHDNPELSLDFYSIAYDWSYDILGEEHQHTQSYFNSINRILAELDTYDENNRFNIDILGSLNRIGYFCRNIGNINAAIGFNNLALSILHNNYPDANSTGLLMNLAHLYNANKDYDKVLDVLDKVLKELNDNDYEMKTDVVIMIGECFFETYYYGKACYYYALCFDGKNDLIQRYPAQFRNYGASLLYVGKFSEGLQILEQLFNSFYPQYNFLGMYYQYGKALILNSKIDDGIKYLSAELESDNICGTCCRMKWRENDIEQSEDSVWLYRNYLYLAKGFHQKGQDNKAEEYFGKALDILDASRDNMLTDKAFVLNEIARFYMDKNLIDEAYKFNTKALNFVTEGNNSNPISGHIFKLQGDILVKQESESEQAKEYYARAYEIFNEFLDEDSH
jgi:tetratricopeptide (TPR) repeat protein